MSPEEALTLLGLRPGADRHEIKRAYRRLAKQTHPDLFPDPASKAQAEERFKKLRAAVDALATGYSMPRPHDGAVPHAAAPFDPRDIYGSTYAYSFARRNPIARSPLLGCFLAFSIPAGAGIAFQEYGPSGLITVLLAAVAIALLLRLLYRATTAIRQWLARLP